jgi:hypothetical protein
MEWVRAQMAKGDTTAARRLFSQDAGLTDGERLEMAQELVRNARRLDPRVLARIILGLPRGKDADRMLWQLVAHWSMSDAEEALHFIETLPAERLNTAGVLHNAHGLSLLPAERLLAFASRLNDKGRSHLAECLVGLADQLGSWRNTAAILDQLDVLAQPDAISPEWFLGRQLADLDSQALESRIAVETDPIRRDKLIEGYASAIGRLDPERGVGLLAQMRHSAPDQITNRVKHWLAIDRASALDWLQSDASRRIMDREARARLLRLYGREAKP